MKTWALEMLCCPQTGSPLSLQDPVQDGEEIVSGWLVATSGQKYPIRDGVPHLTLDYVSEAEAQTVEAFGNQWNKFNAYKGFMSSPELLLNFFPMLKPDDFKDRVVLDAGCGNGRFMLPSANLGAKNLIGIDYSSSVFHAHTLTKHLPNVTVVRGSILQPPMKKGCIDLIFSMGVIDHLQDPAKGMHELGKLLQSKGRLAVWLYSREGNELYLRVIAPLLKIGHRLPTPLLLALSYALALPVWLHTWTVNRWLGVRRDGSNRLPMAGYFKFLMHLSFSDIASVVHDQLSHPLVRYMRRSEVETMFQEAGLSLQNLHSPRGNSWSAAGS